MNPSTMVIVFLVAGVVVLGHGDGGGRRPFAVQATTTPVPAAALFWEKALPATPMPDSIADLVNRGVAHSPLGERYAVPAAAAWRPDACLGYSYQINCGGPGEVAASGFFFHEAAVRVGATMKVTLPPAPTAPFLPRDVADKIPFPTASADAVLAMFNVAPGSAEAAEMSTTLRGCEAPSRIGGEQEACATSLEAVVETAARMLGGGAMWAVASAYPAAGLARQEYVVEAVAPFHGSCCHAACHSARWPYAVYKCHASSAGPSKAYMVTLRSGGGAAVAMAALCHRDTSGWNPEHPALAVLGTHPGGTPVCHFLPYGDLLFGKMPADA